MALFVNTTTGANSTDLDAIIKIGYDSRVGCTKNNQDGHFHWRNDERNLAIIGVIDGHGTHGSLATQICMETFATIDCDELVADPVSFLEHRFQQCHESFKKKIMGDSIIAGGATLSVAVIIDKRLYIASVGDSPIFLCTQNPVLRRSLIKYEKDCALLHSETIIESVIESIIESVIKEEEATSILDLTFNHSAENIYEFNRVRKTYPSIDNASLPLLQFVYHNIKPTRDRRFIFTIDEESKVEKNETGIYHKNVSKEWASGVYTPSGSFLSMTRTIGDLNFNVCGVSEKPEIQSIDLSQLGEESIVCVVAVTDGVADNWIPDHIGRFVMDPSCLAAIAKDPAHRVTKSFLNRNDTFAYKNFGTNTDDATIILAYIDLRIRKPS
jgi:hypothetical protein